MLLIAGMWLLLAGRLNARHRDGNRVSGIALAGRVALVAACWPMVLLGCVIGGVRAPAAGFHPPAGRRRT